LKILNIEMNGSKKLIAGLFRSLGHLHSFKALTRVPTQVTCRIFK